MSNMFAIAMNAELREVGAETLADVLAAAHATPNADTVADIASKASTLLAKTDLLRQFVEDAETPLLSCIRANNAPLFERIVEGYCAAVGAQSWGFSYVDRIGESCRKMFDVSAGLPIRATLIGVLARIGVAHNRFSVMKQLGEILELIVSHSEAGAVEMELRSLGGKSLEVLAPYARIERLRFGLDKVFVGVD